MYQKSSDCEVIEYHLTSKLLLTLPSYVRQTLKRKANEKGLKIAAIVVGVIIILMLLLPFAFQGKIAGIVKTEGNKMLNAQFDFKKLNISLFRNFPQASVTLEDFWLKGAGEFANDTLVQAGEVTATINLFSLSETAVMTFPKYS